MKDHKVEKVWVPSPEFHRHDGGTMKNSEDYLIGWNDCLEECSIIARTAEGPQRTCETIAQEIESNTKGREVNAKEINEVLKTFHKQDFKRHNPGASIRIGYFMIGMIIGFLVSPPIWFFVWGWI